MPCAKFRDDPLKTVAMHKEQRNTRTVKAPAHYTKETAQLFGASGTTSVHIARVVAF